MPQHELKAHPRPFQAVIDRVKLHEIRKDDRGGFAAGDTLLLREWDPEAAREARADRAEGFEDAGYTGRWAMLLVTYVTPAGTWGLPHDLAVLSVQLQMADLERGPSLDDEVQGYAPPPFRGEDFRPHRVRLPARGELAQDHDRGRRGRPR